LKTEQAHSPVKDAIPLGRDPRTAPRAVPTTWLNLVCLDAPIVAVLWLCLFARTFNLPVRPGNAVALFLTAWLIYLADRLADAVSLQSATPRSLRQEFCLRHRESWITGLLLVGGFDLYVIWRSIDAGTFLAGGVIGVLAVVYLALNYPRGLIWRSLPAKEVVIGLLFTAGTLVALLPSARPVPPAFIAAGLAFASLCSLNCISIALWERDLDRAQAKVSLATQYPGIGRYLKRICGFLALLSFAMAISDRSAAALFVCVAISVLLLAILDRLPRELGHDRRTALADLVLLTPIIPLITMAS
jgi:hypothetical protein